MHSSQHGSENDQQEALRVAADWDAIHPTRKRTFARKSWAKARAGGPAAEPRSARQGRKTSAGKPKPRRQRQRRTRQPTYEVPVTRPWSLFLVGL
jgi:hypothetical protein